MRRNGPKRIAECDGCGAAIWWIKSEKKPNNKGNKNVPLDDHEDLQEYFEAYGDWPVDEDDAPRLQDLWRELGRDVCVAHFTTCPNADDFRRD